eukprot:3110502-Prymnesium_polylepis.1
MCAKKCTALPLDLRWCCARPRPHHTRCARARNARGLPSPRARSPHAPSLALALTDLTHGSPWHPHWHSPSPRSPLLSPPPHHLGLALASLTLGALSARLPLLRPPFGTPPQYVRGDAWTYRFPPMRATHCRMSAPPSPCGTAAPIATGGGVP